MRTTMTLEIVMTTLIVVMAAGTLAYHNLEKWSYVDSFYFTGITMTTIGYGDLYPTTDAAKIFTVFFAFIGVGVVLFALSLLATTYFERREKAMGESLQKKLIESVKKSRKDLKRRKRAIIAGSKT